MDLVTGLVVTHTVYVVLQVYHVIALNKCTKRLSCHQPL